MNVDDELQLIVTEANHEQSLKASKAWRDSVSQANQHNDIQEPVCFVPTNRGFRKKWYALGDTKGFRVPYRYLQQVKQMFDMLNQIASKKGIAFADKIIANILTGLERACDT